VKVFFGHVATLQQLEVDYIFLPRIVSMERQTYLCPKLLGFPEVVTALIPDLPPVLTADFNLRKDKRELDYTLQAVGRQLGFTLKQIAPAIAAAKLAQLRFEHLMQAGQDFTLALKGRGVESSAPESGLTIAVLGHAYMLYDGFSSLDLQSKLNKLGVKVVTPERVPPSLIDQQLAELPKKIFWSHSKRILGAGYAFGVDPGVHGLIHLSCFGCGPDSMVGDMVERMCRRYAKPFMMLTLDEHTGEAGLVTRLEAYVDMLTRRAELESNVSAHG
ncbi:MAG: acyl-CoA dehydratase activase-related protein, partial [Peptococcaceae bacterium]|nr:acyl-CoA dehydratase activase-related protein [Peptococcaceae bacterium]